MNCALVAREDKKSCNFRKRDLGKRFQQDLKVQRSSNGSFGGIGFAVLDLEIPFGVLCYILGGKERTTDTGPVTSISQDGCSIP